MSIERQIFATVHEMGHLLLHRESYEEPAEQGGLHWIDRVLAVKRYFRVSYQVVLFRLGEDRRSPPDLQREFALGYQRMSGHDLKHHFEPEGLGKLDFCEERFRLLVRTALEKDKIGVSRAAELLRLPLDTMQELRQSWLEEPVSFDPATQIL